MEDDMGIEIGSEGCIIHILSEKARNFFTDMGMPAEVTKFVLAGDPSAFFALTKDLVYTTILSKKELN